jgi:hypothetical protein
VWGKLASTMRGPPSASDRSEIIRLPVATPETRVNGPSGCAIFMIYQNNRDPNETPAVG